MLREKERDKDINRWKESERERERERERRDFWPRKKDLYRQYISKEREREVKTLSTSFNLN